MKNVSTEIITKLLILDIFVRCQQDKNGKEAWEDIEENPVGYTGQGNNRLPSQNF